MNYNKLCLTIEKLFFIFVLMLFPSCIYEPDGLFENPVNLNPAEPQISNLELNVNADTLWVYGDQTLKYHFKSSNEKQRILGLIIYIDDVLCDSVMSDNGEFDFLMSSLSEGTHKMKILMVAKSGTGSIADRLNAEAILLSKEWVVMAHYSPKNVTYTIENGYLKLHWEKYKNLDLKSYKIQSSVSTQNNYFVDSLYYGAQKTFNISVEKMNGEILPWGSLIMAQNIPNPQFKVSDNNTYYFTWPKSPYYNTVKYGYELNVSHTLYRKGIKNASDTVYISSNLYFSDNFNFRLYILPEKFNENTSYLFYPSSIIRQSAGEPANLRDNTFFTSADTLMAFDAVNLYKYFIGGETVKVDPIMQGNSSSFPKQLSPRGKYLLGITKGSDGNVSKYFAKNLSTGDVYYMDYVDPGYYDLNPHLSTHISDNGIGIFQSATSEFIFDFKNNTQIASRTLSSPQKNLYIFKIAPDGKHVMSSDYTSREVVDVYTINGLELGKMYSIENKSGRSDKWQFNPTDPNRITSVDNNNLLTVIQCEPYALIDKIQLASDEEFMNVDFFNNEILTINSNQFIIRSLKSGNEIKRIARRQEQYYLYETYKLHNHHIIKDNVMLRIQ